MNYVYIDGESFRPTWADYMKRCQAKGRSHAEEIVDDKLYGIVEMCRDMATRLSDYFANVVIYDMDFVIIQKLNATYVELYHGDILVRKISVYADQAKIITFFEQDPYITLNESRRQTLQASVTYYLTENPKDSPVAFGRYTQ